MAEASPLPLPNSLVQGTDPLLRGIIVSLGTGVVSVNEPPGARLKVDRGGGIQSLGRGRSLWE